MKKKEEPGDLKSTCQLPLLHCKFFYYQLRILQDHHHPSYLAASFRNWSRIKGKIWVITSKANVAGSQGQWFNFYLCHTAFIKQTKRNAPSTWWLLVSNFSNNNNNNQLVFCWRNTYCANYHQSSETCIINLVLPAQNKVRSWFCWIFSSSDCLSTGCISWNIRDFSVGSEALMVSLTIYSVSLMVLD